MDKKETGISGHCNSAEELKAYLRQKARMHNSYKCYSRVDRILPIVREHKVYLNNGQNWNDMTDRKNIIDQYGQINFAKCFSFSQDENVAMWMLYGGVHHKGAMVDFTRRGMTSMLETNKITLGYFEKNGTFREVAELDNSHFKTDLIDIVYYNQKSGYLTRSDEGCACANQDLIAKLGACRKVYPWHYENECRLIVSVNADKVPEKCDTVMIDLRGMPLGKSLERAYLCPGYLGEKYEGFRDSKLEGTVSWELLDENCKKCKFGG